MCEEGDQPILSKILVEGIFTRFLSSFKASISAIPKGVLLCLPVDSKLLKPHE